MDKMHELNKHILHHFFQNGILRENNAPDLINKISEKLNLQKTGLTIENIIAEINETIGKHLFRINLKICEITGGKYYVFVNTILDDLAENSTNFSPVEYEFLNAIFHEIMTSNSKSISSILPLNLTNRLKGKITKDAAQIHLDTWCDNGYLIVSNGSVYLGPRAISEFEDYFMKKYSERITKCHLCTDYVFFGKICGECQEVLHKHCAEKQLKRNKCCPVCKKTWTEVHERNYDD